MTAAFLRQCIPKSNLKLCSYQQINVGVTSHQGNSSLQQTGTITEKLNQ